MGEETMTCLMAPYPGQPNPAEPVSDKHSLTSCVCGYYTRSLINFLNCLWPSVLWRCWLGDRKGIRPVKNMGDGGGGHWLLVWMEWCPSGWSMCLPLLIFPCTIRSRSSLLAPAYPGGPGKRAVKQLWWWCLWPVASSLYIMLGPRIFFFCSHTPKFFLVCL